MTDTTTTTTTTAPAEGRTPYTSGEQFPDGAHAYAMPESFPLVTVRFPDGGQVDFRAGSEWPHHAHVRYQGLEIKGHRQRYDADATVAGDGTLTTIPSRIGWKTGVNGVDGADQIPAKVTEHLAALVKRRAREARAACRVAGVQERPAKVAS